jgi:hypothetical protein
MIKPIPAPFCAEFISVTQAQEFGYCSNHFLNSAVIEEIVITASLSPSF